MRIMGLVVWYPPLLRQMTIVYVSTTSSIMLLSEVWRQYFVSCCQCSTH